MWVLQPGSNPRATHFEALPQPIRKRFRASILCISCLGCVPILARTTASEPLTANRTALSAWFGFKPFTSRAETSNKLPRIHGRSQCLLDTSVQCSPQQSCFAHWTIRNIMSRTPRQASNRSTTLRSATIRRLCLCYRDSDGATLPPSSITQCPCVCHRREFACARLPNGGWLPASQKRKAQKRKANANACHRRL